MQDNTRCSIIDYVSDKPAQRSRIFLPQNLVTFLEQGEKVVHYADSKTVITDNQFALLAAGNCLMTEKQPVSHNYRSMMLFFDHSVLTDFYIKYAPVIDLAASKYGKSQKPYMVFEKDDFVMNYIASLKFIRPEVSNFSSQKMELKFEELMLYLLEKYPQEMLSFHIRDHNTYSDLEIRKAVEQNITTNLTLEELAFLCHTSISTFKRRFLKIYNTPPGLYFLHRKMEIAKAMLLQNYNPGEVFHKVGYENHSSFSQSFKKVYGLSPKQFQQENLIDPKQSLTG